MNREKKEALKKEQEIINGMNPEQVNIYREVKEIRTRINKLQGHIHSTIFPEEYDFMNDDHVDIKQRRKGINPMSTEYQEQVNNRRNARGIKPLADNGMCDHADSSQYTRQLTQQLIESGDLRSDIMNLTVLNLKDNNLNLKQ